MLLTGLQEVITRTAVGAGAGGGADNRGSGGCLALVDQLRRHPGR